MKIHFKLTKLLIPPLLEGLKNIMSILQHLIPRRKFAVGSFLFIQCGKTLHNQIQV